MPYGGVETLETYATETGYQQSNYLLAQYTLNYPAAPAPVFSLASGSYSGPQSLTITDSLTGSTILLHDGWYDSDYFFDGIHAANHREQHRDD
jgi:hypothetical protein